MNKIKKYMIIILTTAIAAFSCFLSWKFGWADGYREGIIAGGFTSGITEVILSQSNMNTQLANVTCDGAKRSVKDYLVVLEKYKNNQDIVSEPTYYADKMLAHVRLAQIERKQRNLNEMTKHFTIAKEACIHRNWNDCSEDNLVSFQKKFEDKFPIACLEK